jgi:hypothetical protein
MTDHRTDQVQVDEANDTIAIGGRRHAFRPGDIAALRAYFSEYRRLEQDDDTRDEMTRADDEQWERDHIFDGPIDSAEDDIEPTEPGHCTCGALRAGMNA